MRGNLKRRLTRRLSAYLLCGLQKLNGGGPSWFFVVMPDDSIECMYVVPKLLDAMIRDVTRTTIEALWDALDEGWDKHRVDILVARQAAGEVGDAR